MKNINANTVIIIAFVMVILINIYEVMIEKQPIGIMKILSVVASIIAIISTRYYKQGQ